MITITIVLILGLTINTILSVWMGYIWGFRSMAWSGIKVEGDTITISGENKKGKSFKMSKNVYLDFQKAGKK